MIEVLPQQTLAPFTTWEIGGAADWLARPKTVLEIQEACRWAQERKLPLTLLSGGSNVLISDRGVEGLVLLLKDFSRIESVTYDNGEFRAVCEAGATKSELLKPFVKHRLSPAIFLAGLPGDMGGGVVMNAGIGHDVHPKEFHEIVEWVEFIDLKDEKFPVRRKGRDEIEWTYRKSTGWQPGIITRIGVYWQGEPDDSLLKKLQESNKRRMSTQPLQSPSCGSVFKNPLGNKSGRLIEECGLKGFSIGGAQVSQKHANFIVNTGGATAQNVLDLKSHIQKTVQSEKGIRLETEFIFMGRPPL